MSAAGTAVAPARVHGDGGQSVAGGANPRIASIQRSRILSASIRTVDELGYPNTSVAHITKRARVSRRTFYELFADREACLAAALADVVGLIERELVVAGLGGLSWRERVRRGLWAILSFFDREPVLARVCVVQSLRGGPEVLASRERLLARLAGIVDEGRHEGTRGGKCSPLVAEGLVGAAFSIVYSRLLRRDKESLTGLLGELMGMIVMPYLGPAVARREQARRPPDPVISDRRGSSVAGDGFVGDPFDGVRMRLTYRTTRVLECVGADPGVSNRRVADLAGISDQGQVSKLLSRLERLGLVHNAGRGRPRGEANAWRLTQTGLHITRSINRGVLPSVEGE
jgi:AcrR family transcriptional regulator